MVHCCERESWTFATRALNVMCPFVLRSVQYSPVSPSGRFACTTLRNQILEISAWSERREDEEIAFGILGDFNRRLAVSGDWAWAKLSPEFSPFELLTADIEYRCDPRFREFIDHIALDTDAVALLVPNSTHEWPRHDDHPDHCAVSTDLQVEATR